MPNVYLKIDQKFILTDSSKKDKASRALPIFSRFNEKAFTDIEVILLPQTLGGVRFSLSLGKNDLFSGDYQIIERTNSLEIIIQAVFKISVKQTIIEDVLNPNAKWEFGGLMESGKWDTLRGDIEGLKCEEYFKGQGEWQKTCYRYLINISTSKQLRI